jgi:hypothetical protein
MASERRFAIFMEWQGWPGNWARTDWNVDFATEEEARAEMLVKEGAAAAGMKYKVAALPIPCAGCGAPLTDEEMVVNDETPGQCTWCWAKTTGARWRARIDSAR